LMDREVVAADYRCCSGLIAVRLHSDAQAAYAAALTVIKQ